MDKVWVVLKVSHELGLSHVVGAFDSCKGARHAAYEQYCKVCEFEFGQKPIPEDENKDLYRAQDKNTKYVVYVTGIDMTRNEEFPISILMRKDLEDRHFDLSDVTDNDMCAIASKMDDYYQDGYCEGFGPDLISAASHHGVPRKEEDDEDQQ